MNSLEILLAKFSSIAAQQAQRNPDRVPGGLARREKRQQARAIGYRTEIANSATLLNRKDIMQFTCFR